MSEKSILEQALLQVQTLEEAVKANAKGILASTMKQELNDLLKESMEDEEEVETEEGMTLPKEEEEKDMPEQSEEDEDETGEEEDLDNEDEPSKGIEGMDSDMEDMDSEMEDEMGTDMEDMDSEMEDEMGTDMEDMDSEMEDEVDFGMEDEDVLDMTGASDDEVLKVFKSMKPEDGVIVKKDGEDISMSTGDDEFIIKLDEEEEGFDMEDMDTEMKEGSDMNDEETIYEIELDDEEDMKEEEEEEAHEGDMEEAARTKWNPHGDKGGMNRAGIKSKKLFKAGSSINEEVETLKKQNNEYKKALILFKEKLNEVAVFNANLAYATQLFTEQSTTRQEKLNILKRFDSISTLKESKNLYKTIKMELGTQKPVTESVVEKITSTPKSSSSEKVLSESKAYENPQFKRMKDLMSKIK
jgi:hypothetical protein